MLSKAGSPATASLPPVAVDTSAEASAHSADPQKSQTHTIDSIQRMGSGSLRHHQLWFCSEYRFERAVADVLRA
jgi:hypothetical protein